MKKSMLISIVLAMTALPVWALQGPPAEPMHGQEGMQGMQHMHDMEGMKSGQRPDEEGMIAQCKAMMDKHEAIKAEIEAAQQRLEALVATMNAASGDERVDAMAAVVEELVARQRLHQREMMEMHPQMMHHMMEHMQAMGESGSAGAMMDCPMMKGMGKEGQAPGEASGSPQPSDEHSKHHPPR